jgi:hypothetical protein
MTEQAKAARRLSASEALRALYIDFEGEKDRPPVLLGTLRRGGRGREPFVRQAVLDPLFGPLGPEVRPAHGATRACTGADGPAAPSHTGRQSPADGYRTLRAE